MANEQSLMPAGQAGQPEQTSGKIQNWKQGENWVMYHGDCCEAIKAMPDSSIDFCIHSPPFSNLYIYSDSEADMGNSVDDNEFIQHYEYLIAELFRTTVTGRLCAIHCKDLPKYANRDDTAGLKDFPGQIIDAFERHGWSFHSRVTIWKCPVTERERTNNNGLLHKTVTRDRSQLRQGMADYLIVMRKPPIGTLMSDKPITRDVDDEGVVTSGEFVRYVGDLDSRESNEHPSKFARKAKSKTKESVRIWQRYAEPVWWDIDQTDVLNAKLAREAKDERHICPLQLGLIDRAIQIWSEPGDVVLSPFAGIGSEGVGAIKAKRRFVGIELKESYFNVACKNLEQVEYEFSHSTLF